MSLPGTRYVRSRVYGKISRADRRDAGLGHEMIVLHGASADPDRPDQDPFRVDDR